MERANLQRVFTPNPIVNIEDSDFELDSSIKIMLKIKKCIIILFYSDNTESMNITDVWQIVGNQGLAGVFGACNLKLNPKVAEAFNELNMNNTSLHWAALRTVPFILTYQNGYPIGFYNGERAVQPILDFSMTLACRSDYREPVNSYGGIQAEENIGIKNIDTYEKNYRTKSSEYTTENPLRDYQIGNKPIVLPSPGDKKATELLSPSKDNLRSGSGTGLGSGLRLGGDSKNPLGSNPLGSNPLGSNPLGSNPLGSNPLGSNPLGSNPLGSNPLRTTPNTSSNNSNNTDKSQSDDTSELLKKLLAPSVTRVKSPDFR